jgi:hypothetical protein
VVAAACVIAGAATCSIALRIVIPSAMPVVVVEVPKSGLCIVCIDDLAGVRISDLLSVVVNALLIG